MKSIVLAALIATNVNASKTAADLVSQALAHVESGTQARIHLENAL